MSWYPFKIIILCDLSDLINSYLEEAITFETSFYHNNRIYSQIIEIHRIKNNGKSYLPNLEINYRNNISLFSFLFNDKKYDYVINYHIGFTYDNDIRTFVCLYIIIVQIITYYLWLINFVIILWKI